MDTQAILQKASQVINQHQQHQHYQEEIRYQIHPLGSVKKFNTTDYLGIGIAYSNR